MAKTRAIGLDIGTTYVRAAEVEFGSKGPAGTDRPVVVAFGEAPVPPGALRDGEVVEPAVVSTALKQLWREHKFSSKEVIIGMGNQRVLVRDLELPVMPLAQLRASLPYQVQDFLPIAIEDAHLDYVPTGISENQHGQVVSGLLVAATKDTVKANLDAVEMAGLKPVMVDLTALALTRSIARGDLAESTVALVDLGARITTVVVVERGMPKFVRVLPTGGQDMTDAIAAAMQMSFDEAEALKYQVGIGFAVPNEYTPAAEAVSQVGRVLVEAVRNTLSFYSNNSDEGGIQTVLLSGRGALLPGLGQYIATSARISVALAAPLATMRVGKSLPQGEALDRLQHVTAVPVGLAFGVAA